MGPSKRRPLHPSSASSPSTHLNFRGNVSADDRGPGTRPTPTPSSVGLIILMMIIQVCRKYLLHNTTRRVAIYLGALFLVSMIADFSPMPKTYFARTDNFFNQVFVKWAWGWLLAILVPWVALTSHTIGCGRRSVLLNHLARALVATLAWSLWTWSFRVVEKRLGRCLDTRDPLLQNKPSCLQAGKFWSGLDISGHAFILVYAGLILAEEASSFVQWEGITDLVMREEHTRNTSDEASTRPLRSLAKDDLAFLKKTHKALTPYLRGLFLAMTLQQLLWDMMLLSTILYFHTMLEKVIGGLIAVLTWYVTYHWWYKLPKITPTAPSVGLFKYNDPRGKDPIPASRVRRNTLNGSGPRFMGMPQRPSQEYTESEGTQSF